MTDATRRKLHIPNWYPPYLEKHRIYELFHELGRELIIQKPADHVLFLRQILFHAYLSKDAPRIIILAPPQINTYDFAKKLQNISKATIILQKDITDFAKTHSNDHPKLNQRMQGLSELIRNDDVYETGWILPDFPKTWRDAKTMTENGILPTHVFQIIPPYTPSFNDLNYKKMTGDWEYYRRELLGMKELFQHCLKEIYIGDRNVFEVVNECVDLLKVRKRFKGPIIPRVLILGPRGSGRKTQAKLLAEKFNLVHVDFEQILIQNWISKTFLTKLLRATKDNLGKNSTLLTSVVHKRILEPDCLKQGWVLTGFPNNLDDMKNLDMLDTPPNRIIFLEVHLDICRDRVLNRKVNVYSGSVTYLPNLDQQDITLSNKLKQHPKDKEELLKNEFDYYCEHYNTLRKYCGDSGQIVEGNQSTQWVSECISALLLRPMTDITVRCPCDYDSNLASVSSGGTCVCIDDKYVSESDFSTCGCPDSVV